MSRLTSQDHATFKELLEAVREAIPSLESKHLSSVLTSEVSRWDLRSLDGPG